MEMKRLKAIMRKEEVIGYQIGFKIIKNKLGRPGLSCETPYMFGEGFGKSGDLVQMGLDAGFIQQAGAFYTIEDKKYQGKEKASLAIEGDLDLKTRLLTTLFPQQNPHLQSQE